MTHALAARNYAHPDRWRAIVSGAKFVVILAIACGTAGCATLVTTDGLYKILEQADQAYSRGDWNEAENLYKIIETKSPQDANSEFRLGNAYANQGRYDEAIIAYRKAIVRDPRSAKAYNNLAIAHMKEAEKAFVNSVMHLTPNDSFGGRACEMLGEVRGMNRNTSKTNAEPVVAEWCRIKKVSPSSTEDWVDKHGPPMTVVQVLEPSQGACVRPAGLVAP